MKPLCIPSDNPLRFVGIDGCRAGWFYMGLDAAGRTGFGLLGQIRELPALITPDARVLVDIPMGLKETGPKERDCDLEARALLGRKSASIFPAPARPALTLATYPEASAANQACTGRKLSKQTFNLMKKIREADEFLAMYPHEGRIMESHPELVFLALNQWNLLEFSKKTAQGRHRRLAILVRFLSGAAAVFDAALATWPRKSLAPDDILDALALAVAAGLPLRSLPQNPETDARGLPMQIVYPDLQTE